MEQELWLQHKDHSVLFDAEGGRLDVKEIATVWNLDPSSLVIASRKVKMGDNGLSTLLVDAFRGVEEGRDGRSKEKALSVHGQPSTDNESSKLGHVIALLKKLVTGQRRLEKGLHASLWLTFWGDIASTVTSETTVQFRKSLVDYYGDEMDKNNVDDAKLPLRCMVTDLRLPGTWITAAHLLGRKHSTKAHVFGFHDIDDPRNGLLWNRAFEEAYSYYRTVFSWDRDNNSFCIHVLDKDLLGENISGIKMRKPFNRSMDTFMDVQTIKQFNEMTFGDLQGKLVSFNNLNRPFKRVLCLHAKLGIQKAKEEGSLPAGLDLGQYNFDYWTESSNSILLRTFLEDSQPWIKESDLEGLSLSSSADTSI